MFKFSHYSGTHFDDIWSCQKEENNCSSNIINNNNNDNKDTKRLTKWNIYRGTTTVEMKEDELRQELQKSVCNKIHCLLEYMGSAFEDVLIVNP